MTAERYDWNAIVDGLTRHLRLRSIPIGMKLFETVEAMEAIPKIRRPKAKHTTDQIVAQARGGPRRPPARDGRRALRALPRPGGLAAPLRAARPARRVPGLRHAGPDDPVHQRPAVGGLQEARRP